MKTLIFLLAALPAIIFAQISPGDLSEFHKDLEGISHCTKCHVLGKKVTNRKCLDCHEKIDNLITAERGYHSSSDVNGKKCASCHPEHFGRDFELIRFNREKFDHKLTGYKLEGAHAKNKCEDCHKSDLIKDNKLKKKKGTFLGMGTRCKSCHVDYHQGTLDDDCASCHNIDKFRPAPKFDHNKARFKLTGKHKNTDCIKCHKKTTRNDKEFQQFKNINFNTCESCHKDQHNGKFGKDCARCHVTSSFRQIGNRKNFNHSKTGFPLVGKHREVNCNSCHGMKLSSKPKHELCIDCHEDYHKGEMNKEGKLEDCGECHTVSGFRPSLFTIEDHSKLHFALKGAHLAVPCIACHLKEDRWKFTLEFDKCEDCHQNKHKNVMSSKYTDKGCKTCHSVDTWKKIGDFDHTKTKFKLTGKHKQAACIDCHLKEPGVIESQEFKNLSMNCENCHKDIHFGQFRFEGKTDCSACHTPENWKPDKFDHETTRFSLSGAHSKVQCFECHRITEKDNKRYVQFKIEDIRCASCHTS